MSESEFLLVETGQDQQALPLNDVLRIERIPRTRIEWLGEMPVLRFDGTLLPLEDRSRLLARAELSDAEITVVVCRDGERHVGVTVSQVLDVASGAPLVDAGTRNVAPDVTLLKERVTGVVNLSRIPELPMPVEVGG